MSRLSRAIVGAAAVGGALVVGVLVAMDRNGEADRAAPTANATALRTPWGEPDLTGVWRGSSLGAGSGGDTFNLMQLQSLYNQWGKLARQRSRQADRRQYRRVVDV